MRRPRTGSAEPALSRAGQSATERRTFSVRVGHQLARRDARRATRVTARLRRGQTLIIFALSFTVLLGLAGIAIDVARAYDLYAKMQRAAEAGAVAGVLYVPTNYNTARLPGEGLTAISRATAEMTKDGFGAALPVGTSDCPTPVNSVEVAVCRVSSAPNDLEVFITESLNVVLLSGLGVQPITLQAKAEANYMPPAQLGSRANFFGDEVECTPQGSTANTSSICSPSDTSQNHLQYFMATTNGPAELKEDGDPYVYCAEGNADAATVTSTGLDPGSTSANPFSLYTYNGYATDHPQWPGVTTGTTTTSNISAHCGLPNPSAGKPGNSDYQPAGFSGPITSASTQYPGGYNYVITIASGVSPSTLWIYNPFFVPQNEIQSPEALDHFLDTTPGGACSSNSYQGPTGEGIGTRFDCSHRDAPLLYYSITYSLYQVNNLFDRGADTLVATETFNPFDATTTDLNYHTCNSGQVYNPYWNGPDTPNFYHKAGSASPNQGCVTSNALSTTCPSAGQWCALRNCPLGTSSLVNNPQLTCTVSPYILNSNSTGGTYRLVVETQGLTAAALNGTGGYDYNAGPMDGWGRHSYALKLCASTTITTPVNCPNGNGTTGAGGFTNTQMAISGWNNDVIVVQDPVASNPANANNPQTSCVSSATTPYACVDLGCIPAAYAGRTLTIGLYDPGDALSGDLYVGLSPPAGSGSTVTLTYPSYASTTTIDGVKMVQTRVNSSGYAAWNGLWLNVTVQLSSTYAGTCVTGSGNNTGWFQLVYAGANAQPTDTLAIALGLVGSPVHLVPPV